MRIWRVRFSAMVEAFAPVAASVLTRSAGVWQCRSGGRGPAWWLSTLGPAERFWRPSPMLGGRLGERRWEGEGRRDRVLSMVHNTPILLWMARPGGPCTRSVLSTPGLGSGAGVGVLCTIPATLSTRSATKSEKRLARAQSWGALEGQPRAEATRRAVTRSPSCRLLPWQPLVRAVLGGYRLSARRRFFGAHRP